MIRAEFLADPALGAVWDALPAARVVGGAVRDALAGLAVADVDLATPEAPEAVMAALRQAGLKVVPTGLAHGTVTAMVAFTSDWQEDAARRDFTINAMSMTRDGAVFDYFGGAEDLASGRVRFVGDPATRIAEDYLRILRFFRFQARFGRAAPDEATLAALRAGIPGLARLSVERVWHEVRRILAAPDPSSAIGLMVRLGIWAAVMPEAPLADRLDALPADPVLRLAAMLRGDPLALAVRLKMSNEDRDRLARLVATPSPKGTDADLRRLLADHAPADLIDRAWLDGDGLVRQRLAGMKRPVFPLVGRDVVALGVAAGPAVGALLRAVRGWWMDGGCVADRTACLTELARRAKLPNMGTTR